jgi:hypothetical protein
MERNDPALYGAERACGECGGKTFLAMQHVADPVIPSRVQARCKQLTCSWKGRVIDAPKIVTASDVVMEESKPQVEQVSSAKPAATKPSKKSSKQMSLF